MCQLFKNVVVTLAHTLITEFQKNADPIVKCSSQQLISHLFSAPSKLLKYTDSFCDYN